MPRDGRSNLLLNAFVFIVKAIKGTRLCSSGKKGDHLVLVKIHLTSIAVIFFVVIIKHAAFTRGAFLIHVSYPPTYIDWNYYSIKETKCKYAWDNFYVFARNCLSVYNLCRVKFV